MKGRLYFTADNDVYYLANGIYWTVFFSKGQHGNNSKDYVNQIINELKYSQNNNTPITIDIINERIKGIDNIKPTPFLTDWHNYEKYKTDEYRKFVTLLAVFYSNQGLIFLDLSNVEAEKYLDYSFLSLKYFGHIVLNNKIFDGFKKYLLKNYGYSDIKINFSESDTKGKVYNAYSLYKVLDNDILQVTAKYINLIDVEILTRNKKIISKSLDDLFLLFNAYQGNDRKLYFRFNNETQLTKHKGGMIPADIINPITKLWKCSDIDETYKIFEVNPEIIQEAKNRIRTNSYNKKFLGFYFALYYLAAQQGKTINHNEEKFFHEISISFRLSDLAKITGHKGKYLKNHNEEIRTFLNDFSEVRIYLDNTLRNKNNWIKLLNQNANLEDKYQTIARVTIPGSNDFNIRGEFIPKAALELISDKPEQFYLFIQLAFNYHKNKKTDFLISELLELYPLNCKRQIDNKIKLKTVFEKFVSKSLIISYEETKNSFKFCLPSLDDVDSFKIFQRNKNNGGLPKRTTKKATKNTGTTE